MKKLSLTEPLTIGFACDQPGEHVRLRIARALAPTRDQIMQVSQKLADRPIATLEQPGIWKWFKR